MNERVAIFIDGSNFYHSVRTTLDYYDNQIDFNRLLDLLKGSRLMVGAHYYNASLDREYKVKAYWRQQAFFNKLRKIPGLNVILCHMNKRRRLDGTFEFSVKGDDIHLATDMVSLAYENQYDTAILVSGDGDFYPAVIKVQKLGKRVENAYLSKRQSYLLKQTCDSSRNLDSLVGSCIRKDKDLALP